MKVIIISGPSGSGKTTLSKKILKKLKNTIILNTDNYYKTGIKSQIFSKIVPSYFDKKISLNFKLLKKDLIFIINNGFSKLSYNYDFKRKVIIENHDFIENIRCIIIEGIFAKEILNISDIKANLFISLKTSKRSCMKRVIERDFINRGKSKNHAKKDFLKGWELFHENNKKNYSKNYFKKIIIKEKDNQDYLIKKFINLIN